MFRSRPITRIDTWASFYRIISSSARDVTFEAFSNIFAELEFFFLVPSPPCQVPVIIFIYLYLRLQWHAEYVNRSESWSISIIPQPRICNASRSDVFPNSLWSCNQPVVSRKIPQIPESHLGSKLIEILALGGRSLCRLIRTLQDVVNMLLNVQHHTARRSQPPIARTPDDDRRRI